MPKNTPSLTRNIVIALLFVAIVVGGGARWYMTHRSAGVSGGGITTSLDPAPVDPIKSWQFQGAYSGNADLTKKANNEIARLQALVGKSKEFTDYTLYVSIADQYNLLGDGSNEYTYLKKALAIDPQKTGLAWYNLGALYEQLGALKSAKDAYAHAAIAQSQIYQYVSAYIEFLTNNFKDDTSTIEAAFSDARKVYGDAPALLEIHAHWQESLGNIKAAINDLQQARKIAPDPAVDSEILQLQKQL